MNHTDVLVSNVQNAVAWLKMTIEDFSDQDLMARPCPGANHANWQIGHLISGALWMSGGCGAKIPSLPTDFAERYTKETAASDDASKFARKQDLVALLEKVHQDVAGWIGTLTPADLDKPGPESMRAYCPTVGSVALLLGQHIFMHMGQIQAIRRKLGKKVLF